MERRQRLSALAAGPPCRLLLCVKLLLKARHALLKLPHLHQHHKAVPGERLVAGCTPASIPQSAPQS
jgi:hypothetical protein